MKIYLANKSREQVGGGWTWMRTFKKYALAHARFVDTWQEADVVIVPGITLVDIDEIKAAKKAGKPVIFRIGNVPRASRNKGDWPAKKMKELAEYSDVVVHQSEWSKRYTFPLVGDGPVIYNGVDTKVFFPLESQKPSHERWLFAFHGKNETKNFWTAYFLFQNRHRENPNAEFWFINTFPSGADGKEFQKLQDGNYDFWNGEEYEHVNMPTTPGAMADVMRQCTHLVHPAVADACPNTVLEARACGLEIVGAAPLELAGTGELLDPNLDISAERMVEEYIAVCKLAMSDTEVG